MTIFVPLGALAWLHLQIRPIHPTNGDVALLIILKVTSRQYLLDILHYELWKIHMYYWCINLDYNVYSNFYIKHNSYLIHEPKQVHMRPTEAMNYVECQHALPLHTCMNIRTLVIPLPYRTRHLFLHSTQPEHLSSDMTPQRAANDMASPGANPDRYRFLDRTSSWTVVTSLPERSIKVILDPPILDSFELSQDHGTLHPGWLLALVPILSEARPHLWLSHICPMAVKLPWSK